MNSGEVGKQLSQQNWAIRIDSQVLSRSSAIAVTLVDVAPGDAINHFEPRPMENDDFAAWALKVS